LSKIWLNWVKFGIKFDSVWAKIKILHLQKHSISYGYDQKDCVIYT